MTPAPNRGSSREMRLWLTGGAFVLVFALGGACSIEGRDGGGESRPPGPTEECEATCFPKHPDGESAYRALRSCLLCRACANLCEPSVGDLCEPQPALDGCSSSWATCEDCVASPCALQQQADTTFVGTCAAEGNACLQTPGCVSLNNCVASCL